MRFFVRWVGYFDNKRPRAVRSKPLYYPQMVFRRGKQPRPAGLRVLCNGHPGGEFPMGD